MPKFTLVLLWLAVLVSVCLLPAHGWTLTENWSGNNFFNNFWFWTANDPTDGYVDYVSYQNALSWGYIKPSNPVYIGCDFWSVSSGRGRGSVRLQTNQAWNYGLFIFDINHMPEGCGTWPAYWFVGPNWPNGGEADIIEGVNVNTEDQTTLHTSDGCTMSSSTSGFSGHWGTGSNGQPSTNCYINAPNQYSNQGCSIISNTQNYGSALNKLGGGVFATQWVPNYGITMWFFPRGSIPSDITNHTPNPNTWGTPTANFPFSSNCPSSHFSNMSVIINLTFCGQWAGGVFGQDCPQYGNNCNSYVQNNPADFQQSYWSVNSLQVYQ